MKNIVYGERAARIPDEVVEIFRTVEVATLGHLTDFGFPRGLQFVTKAQRFAGRALTVRLPHVDATAIHLAIDMIQPGDVIVIDQSGDEYRSSFGGTLAAAAAERGAVSAVIDGRTNDISEINALNFPVYSRGITALTTRVLGREGGVNVPIAVGGIPVMPGDLVFGDESGVAVVAQADATTMSDALLRHEAAFRDADWLGQIRNGARLSDLSGAHAMKES